MKEMTCVMCNEMRFESYGQETSIGFVCFEDECVNESRIKIDKLVAALTTRLQEADAVIKDLNSEIPSSTIMFYGWLGELRRRAAAWLKGGE